VGSKHEAKEGGCPSDLFCGEEGRGWRKKKEKKKKKKRRGGGWDRVGIALRSWKGKVHEKKKRPILQAVKRVEEARRYFPRKGELVKKKKASSLQSEGEKRMANLSLPKKDQTGGGGGKKKKRKKGEKLCLMQRFYRREKCRKSKKSALSLINKKRRREGEEQEH